VIAARERLIMLERVEVLHIPLVQVIIAALNEEEGIEPTIAELKSVLGRAKFLVVDGHSVDATVEKAKSLGAEIILQDGRGKGDAVAKAIEHIASDTDYVVITDADYTYPAKSIPDMIQTLEANPHIGMVCGNRFSGYLNLKGTNSVFYLGNRLIAFAHNILNGVQLVDPLTGLRVVRAGILRGWKVESKGFDVEVELNHRVEREGFGIVELPIEYRERLGEKKLGARHGAEILKRMILEATN
jgi:glycosyltransferase involved in cell wall biosynthesis